MDIVQLNSHRHSSSGSGLSRADVEAMKAAVLLLKFMRSEFELGPIPPIDSRKMSPGLVLALLDEATESGLRGLSEVERGRKVRLGRLLADIRDVRRRLRVVPSLSTIVSVADFAGVIRSLRGAETISALCKNVCAEAASVTGLGCVSISEVNGDDWTVVGTFFAQGGGQDAGALATMPLTPGSPEKHAVDRRTAVLALPDWKRGQDNTVEMSGVLSLGSAGYVVAPIPVSTGLVGLVHASRGDGREPGLAERNLLEAFACSFGMLFERALMSERLSVQKRLILDRLEEETREVQLISSVGVAFGERHAARSDPLSDSMNPMSLGLDELTLREREVFQLLSEGRSNIEVAEELVISIFTVKSHVKKILRKLGAVNRSEAVYRYLDMAKNGEAPQ